MSNTIDKNAQAQYNAVVQAGLDPTTKKINTVLGDAVNAAGKSVDSFMQGQGKDTTKVNKDISDLNAATQANDTAGYAKAAAQLAIDMGASIQANVGGLSGVTPGKGGLVASSATASNAYKNSQDPNNSSKQVGSDSVVGWLSRNKDSSAVQATEVPGANTTLMVNQKSGEIAAFDTDTGKQQNLPSWASKGQSGTLILADGSRFDVSKSTNSNQKVSTAIISGDEIATDGQGSANDSGAVANYLSGCQLGGHDAGPVSVAAKHKDDDAYGYATAPTGLDPSTDNTTFKNASNKQSYSLSDITSSNPDVAAALKNPSNQKYQAIY